MRRSTAPAAGRSPGLAARPVHLALPQQRQSQLPSRFLSFLIVFRSFAICLKGQASKSEHNITLLGAWLYRLRPWMEHPVPKAWPCSKFSDCLKHHNVPVLFRGMGEQDFPLGCPKPSPVRCKPPLKLCIVIMVVRWRSGPGGLQCLHPTGSCKGPCNPWRSG